jgi:hypothetical protein
MGPKQTEYQSVVDYPALASASIAEVSILSPWYSIWENIANT